MSLLLSRDFSNELEKAFRSLFNAIPAALSFWTILLEYETQLNRYIATRHATYSDENNYTSPILRESVQTSLTSVYNRPHVVQERRSTPKTLFKFILFYHWEPAFYTLGNRWDTKRRGTPLDLPQPLHNKDRAISQGNCWLSSRKRPRGRDVTNAQESRNNSFFINSHCICNVISLFYRIIITSIVSSHNQRELDSCPFALESGPRS